MLESSSRTRNFFCSAFFNEIPDNLQRQMVAEESCPPCDDNGRPSVSEAVARAAGVGHHGRGGDWKGYLRRWFKKYANSSNSQLDFIHPF